MLLWNKGEESLNEMIMLFKKNDIVRLKEEYFDRIKSKLFRIGRKIAYSHEQADFLIS